MPDIDIDFANRELALDVIRAVAASITPSEKHKTGVYCTSIPYNPLTNISTIDYKSAEQRGYFKIDLLNVSVYEKVRDRQHMLSLMHQEPIWDLLLQDDFSNMLFQVNGHGSILREMKPSSVEQLAAVLAVIRPAKRYLIGKPWNIVEAEVWVKPEGEEYYFKKAHAIAYAHVIVVQMNLICENLSDLSD
jgi:hypothetical protein